MTITNASNKTIMLINNKRIEPKKTITLEIKKSSDVYQQIMNLNKKGLIDIM